MAETATPATGTTTANVISPDPERAFTSSNPVASKLAKGLKGNLVRHVVEKNHLAVSDPDHSRI